MNVVVQSKTLEITDALRAFCHKQASKVSRFGKKISSVSIYIENVKRKKNDPRSASVKYSVTIPGAVLVVQRTATNMYEAVVDATNGITRQMRKTKEKRITKKRN
jgi:putative sigma-54 modulation protein